jgi:hypothetical protein
MKNSPLSIKYFYFLLFAVPLVVLFQNCGQNGSIEMQQVQESIKSGPNEDQQGDNPNSGLIVDPDSQKSVQEACSDIAISDFLLKTDLVSSGLIIIDDEKSISFEKQTLKVKAVRDAKFKHLNIVLNEAGNQVMDHEGRVYNLKTPSGQTSGLKVHLLQEVSVQATKSYVIKFNISIADQIITNPSKCIFKPVVKNVQLIPAE